MLICKNIYQVSFNQWDFPDEEFQWIAKVWLDVRSGQVDCKNYIHGATFNQLSNLAYALFFDFHSLMNDEIIFLHLPKYIQDKNVKYLPINEANLSSNMVIIYKKNHYLSKLALEFIDNFEKNIC